ncbi:MAG: 3-isopropylmalate dehydrogenase [Deltaproteobacteria bacterium]|nr:3-isopropylmalate dehydrogenase [Deltaproteobacteria bacterium]
MAAKIAVLGGDGIGPEVTAEAVACLRALDRRAGLGLEFEEGQIGGCAIDAHGTALPDSTLRLVRESDAVLLGAVGGPKWDDPKAVVRPEQGLLTLRRELELFANLRPVKPVDALVGASTLKEEVVRGVDILVIRELTGGIYFGKPSERRDGPHGREAVDTLLYTEGEIQRVVEMAFDLARGRKNKVTSVDKANVLSSSRLWREVAGEVAAKNEDVAFENLLVDAMAMHLISRPRDFDVIVTENMFGDILTDEAAMLPGSMGLLPSASLGTRRSERTVNGEKRAAIFGLYEPIHGSAPDIAGKGVANPLAAILSAAFLLRYSLAAEEAAQRIEAAVAGVLADGLRTGDLARPGEPRVSTTEMGAAVRERLARGAA